MTDALHDTIRRFILENYLFTDDLAQLGLDDSLLGRGIVDSTGMLEVITFLESEYGISIDDAEMTPDNLETIDRIANFVSKKQSAAR